MFLGYQNNIIAFAANTKEELENLQYMPFTNIVETDENYVLENGSYVKQDEEYFHNKIEVLKKSKYSENTQKAKQAIENGYVIFNDAEFETNAQTVSDLTAAMLILQAQQNALNINRHTEKQACEVILAEVSQNEEDSSVASLSQMDNNAVISNPTTFEGAELTYTWLSKDDKDVVLTLEDFCTLGSLIADFKNTIWNEKYLYFKTLIEKAETVDELENIVIDYNIQEEIEVQNDNL